MLETTPAPGAVSPAEITPATPAATAPSAETTESVTPEGTAPAGETEQPAAPNEALEKKPTPAEEARKQRNRERWQQMRQEAADARRREHFLLNEVERLKKQSTTDYSQIDDPDRRIAAMTADQLRQSQIEDHEATRQRERATQDNAVREAWSAIADEMRAKYPDFDTVVTANTPIHPRAAMVIVESEKGGDLAYWLGKNPEAARDLAQKFETSPAQAYLELGRIEGKLSPRAARTVSTAPKPANVISGGVSSPGFDIKTASVEDVAQRLKKAGLIR